MKPILYSNEWHLDTHWTNGTNHHTYCKFYPYQKAQYIYPSNLPIKFLLSLISSATPAGLLSKVHSYSARLHLNLLLMSNPSAVNGEGKGGSILLREYPAFCFLNFFSYFFSSVNFPLSIFPWSDLKSIFGSFCPSFLPLPFPEPPPCPSPLLLH